MAIYTRTGTDTLSTATDALVTTIPYHYRTANDAIVLGDSNTYLHNYCRFPIDPAPAVEPPTLGTTLHTRVSSDALAVVTDLARRSQILLGVTRFQVEVLQTVEAASRISTTGGGVVRSVLEAVVGLDVLARKVSFLRLPTESANSTGANNYIEIGLVQSLYLRSGSDTSYLYDSKIERRPTGRRSLSQPLSHPVFALRARGGIADQALVFTQHFPQVLIESALAVDSALRGARVAPRTAEERLRTTQVQTVVQFLFRSASESLPVSESDEGIRLSLRIQSLTSGWADSLVLSAKYYYRAASDQVHAFDEPVPPNTHVRRPTDSIPLADSATSARLSIRTQSLTTGWADVLQRSNGLFSRSASEATTAVDSYLFHVTGTRTASDVTLIFAEGAVQNTVRGRNTTEPLATFDSYLSPTVHPVLLSDSAPATGTVAAHQVLFRSTSELAVAVDAVARMQRAIRALSDTLLLFEVSQPSSLHARASADSTTLFESNTHVGFQYRNVSDALAYGETVTAPNGLRARSAVDTVTCGDSLYVPRNIIITRPVSDTYPYPGEFPSRFQRFQRYVGDGNPLFENDTTQKFNSRQVADAVQGVDSLISTAPKTRQAIDVSGGQTEATTQSTVRSRTTSDVGEAVYVDNITRFQEFSGRTVGYGRPAADAVGPASDVLAQSQPKFRSLSEPLSTLDVGTINQQVFRSMSDDISLGAGVYEIARRILTNLRPLIESILTTDLGSRTLLSTRTAPESILLSDASTRSILATKTPIDSAPALDAAVKQVFRGVLGSDATALTDTATRSLIGTRALYVDFVGVIDSATCKANTVHVSAVDFAAATDRAVRIGFGILRTGTDTLVLTDATTRSLILARGLYERTTPNLLLGITFTESGWTNSGLTIMANAAPAPDGTFTASRVTSSTAADSLGQQVVVSPGVHYTFSFYARQAGAGAFGSYAVTNDTNGTTVAVADYSGQISSTGWTQVFITVAAPQGCTLMSFYPVRNSGIPVDLLLVQAQVERGTTRTTYQPGGGRLSTFDYSRTVGGILRSTADAAPAVDLLQVGRFLRSVDVALGTDVATRSLLGIRAATEALTISAESGSAQIYRYIRANDHAFISEALLTGVLSVRSSTDSTSLTDNGTAVKGNKTRFSFDQAAGQDTWQFVTLRTVSAQDSLPLPTDAVLRLVAASRLLTEAAGGLDTLLRLVTQRRDASDTTALTDASTTSATQTYPRSATDSAPAYAEIPNSYRYFHAFPVELIPTIEVATRNIKASTYLYDASVLVESTIGVRGQLRLATETLALVDVGTSVPGPRVRACVDIVQAVDDAHPLQYVSLRGSEAYTYHDQASLSSVLARVMSDLLATVDRPVTYVLSARLSSDATTIFEAIAYALGKSRYNIEGSTGIDGAQRQVMTFRLHYVSLLANGAWSDGTFSIHPRGIFDVAPATASSVSTAQPSRSGADVAAAADTVQRMLAAIATGLESLTLLEAASRVFAGTRAVLEALSMLDSASTIYRACRQPSEALATRDGLLQMFVRFIPYGPPIVTITAVSNHKVGATPGCDAMKVDFAFDRNVVAWRVVVTTTGQTAASWTGIITQHGFGHTRFGHAPFGRAVTGQEIVQQAEAIVAAVSLRPGANEVDVIAQAEDGHWSAALSGSAR